MEISKTPAIVKNILEHDIFVVDMLQQGLINYSALARRIYSEVKKQNPKVKLESLVVYIRRYADTLEKNEISKSLRKIISSIELIVKNDMVQITFEKDKRVVEAFNNLSNKFQFKLGEMFFIIHGTEEISIFLNKNMLEIFKPLLKNAIDTTKGLGVISLKEPFYQPKETEFSREVPGYLAFLTNLLARNNINIVEIASTHSQMIFVIKEKEIVKAYEVLDKCIKEFRT